MASISDTLARLLAADRAATDALHEDVASIFTLELERLTRLAADNLEAATRGEPISITAAAAWSIPNPDEILHTQTAASDLASRTAGVRTHIAETSVAGTVAHLGIAWDLSNPAVSGVITGLGQHITGVVEGQRADIMGVIQRGYDEGASISTIATSLRDGTAIDTRLRGEMIARTELTRATSGGSLAVARIVNAASPDTGMRKTWIATEDDRTREAHAEAADTYGEGKGIPLEAPFLVDGEELQYPGDDGSPENTINCRCTVGYEQRADSQQVPMPAFSVGGAAPMAAGEAGGGGVIGDVVPARLVGDEWAANPTAAAHVEEATGLIADRYTVPLDRVWVNPNAEEFQQLAGKGKDNIYVSPKFLDDEWMAAREREFGETTSQGRAMVNNSRQGVIVHEYGHVIDGWLLSNDRAAYDAIHAWMDEETAVNIEGRTVMQKRLEQNLQAPSMYALDNEREWIAEAFSDWLLNGESARAYSQAVGRMIDDAVGRSAAAETRGGIAGSARDVLAAEVHYNDLVPRLLGRFRGQAREVDRILNGGAGTGIKKGSVLTHVAYEEGGEVRAFATIAEHDAERIRISGIMSDGSIAARDEALRGIAAIAERDGKRLIYAGTDEATRRYLLDAGMKEASGGKLLVFDKRGVKRFLDEGAPGRETGRGDAIAREAEPGVATPGATTPGAMTGSGDGWTVHVGQHYLPGEKPPTYSVAGYEFSGGTTFDVAVDGQRFAVYVEGAEGYDSAYLGGWLAARIREIPAGERYHLRTINFLSRANPDDSYWARVYNTPGFRSAATGGDGELTWYNGARAVARVTDDPGEFRWGKNTFRHEMGHLIGGGGNVTITTAEESELRRLVGSQQWSQWSGRIYAGPRDPNEWARAVISDHPVTKRFSLDPHSAIDGEGAGVTKYGSQAMAEDWADSVKWYLIDREKGYAIMSGGAPLRFADLFPARAAILDGVFGVPVIASGEVLAVRPGEDVAARAVLDDLKDRPGVIIRHRYGMRAASGRRTVYAPRAHATTVPHAAAGRKQGDGMMAVVTLATDEETTRQIGEAAATIIHCSDYGDAYWNASTGDVWWVACDGDPYPEGENGEPAGTSFEEIEQRFLAIDGVKTVTIEAESMPPDGYEQVEEPAMSSDTTEATATRALVLAEGDPQAADEPHAYAPIDPEDAPDGACAICGKPKADDLHDVAALGDEGDEYAVRTVRGLTPIDLDGEVLSLASPLASQQEATDEPLAPPVADGGTPFRAVLAVEGTPTDDGRLIEAGALEWRDLPLTLMAIIKDSHGGMPQTETMVAGRIDAITRDGSDIVGTGVFDTGDVGVEIARLVKEKMLTGISVDLAVAESEEMIGDAEDLPDGAVEDPFFGDAYLFIVKKGTIMGATVCPFPAFGGATIEVVVASGGRLPGYAMPRVTLNRLSGALRTVTCLGYFAPTTPPTQDNPDPDVDQDSDVNPLEGSTVAVTAYVDELPDADTLATIDATGIAVTYQGTALSLTAVTLADPDGATVDVPIAEPITASAAGMVPVHPPAAWFDYPAEATGDTLLPLTVTAEGRVYGHVAAFNECHIGSPGKCVEAPHHYRPASGHDGCAVCGEPESRAKHSQAGYDYFHLGEIETEEGEPVRVGQITVATNHAQLASSVTVRQAQQHYDHTGSAVADVHLYEDLVGIMAVGALRPDVPAHRVREFRASKPSGDWRPVRGRQELIALLGTNTPGFPIPRRSRVTQDGATRDLALVAAGYPDPGKAGVPCQDVEQEVRDLIATARVETIIASARAHT